MPTYPSPALWLVSTWSEWKKSKSEHVRALLSALSSRKEEELLFSYERSIKWTRLGGWLSFPGQLFYKRNRTRNYLTNVLIRVGESKSWCTHWLEFTKTFFICCKSWSKFVLVPNNCFLVFFLFVCLFVCLLFLFLILIQPPWNFYTFLGICTTTPPLSQH